MAWATVKGFNFRSTLGFIADGTNEQFVNSAVAYPTTNTIGGDSVTYGWTSTSGLGDADRSAGEDRRLAGINWTNASDYDFQVDLPATGDYKIRLGIGDQAAARTQEVKVFDNATLKLDISGTTGAADHFFDSGGTDRTGGAAGTWVGTLVQTTVTFASTTLKVRMIGAAGVTCLTHLDIEQVGGAAARGLFMTPPVSGLGVGGSFFRDPLQNPRS